MSEYTNVGRVYDIEPAIKGVSDLSSAHIAVFITDASADIDARIAKIYTLPFTDVPPLITSIGTDLTIYRILSRRIFTQAQLKDSTWPDRFKEAMDTLTEIMEGNIELVNSAGTIIAARTDVAELWSNKMNYLPTFDEHGIDTHFSDNIQDEDKVDDLLNDRDL